MYYDKNFFDQFIDWVFSFNGIITIALIILAISLIYKYFGIGKKDNDDNEQLPKYYSPQKQTNYDTEFGSDNSFWDGINETSSEQGTNIYPTRDEEPIPPNAIPPSPYFEEELFEELKVYEKEITTKVIEDDILIDEEITFEKKENE
jgi:hypothetical protein